jgi:DNA-binding transcriptional LysR family regulator
MVVTAGRRYLERFTERLPVVIVPSPVHFPRIFFYQVWHQRADKSSAGQWLRDQIHEVAAPLSVPLP